MTYSIALTQARQENKMATHSTEGSRGGPSPSSPSNSDGATASTDENYEHSQNNANFECNICLDTARDAVISLCGHLFCWPCLHRWLETRPNKSVCPVCKAGISKDKVIPLFGRGSNSNQDPREKMPPRPQARRPEPENNGPFPGFGGFGGEGFQLSFGIGAFPFALFTSTFGGGNQQTAAPPGSPQAQDEQFLSKLFLWVAFLFIFWLLIA